MLFVERSNRTERLLEGLTARLMAPGRDPLAPAAVVVQGPGMERWIAQSIAREHGVCANTGFLFPRAFLERVFQTIPDERFASPNAAWDVRNLTWRVAKRLEAGRGDPDFAPLGRHLDALDGDWRLVQLAHRLANLLDQYITFRPDWVGAWARASTLPSERDERWQARLFREVHAECGAGHVADRALAFRDAVLAPDRTEIEHRLASAFPDTIEIFAVSALPPLYLSVVSDLARLRDVHLSVLSPSRQYWADLWQEVRDEPAFTTPVAALLAGLGRLGGDFQRLLEDTPEIREDEVDRFESPPASTPNPSLLERLQTRLLDLDIDEAATDAESARRVPREDASIRVHLCHGPRRELEVVESLLRDAFERDPSLQPEDVIVMAPAIDAIAPDIEAVFGAAEAEGAGIPFRIADRGIFRRSPVAEAFRGLLELLGGRGTRSEVLDWVAHEPVRGRFGLEDDGVEGLGEWAARAGIRFGFDETHREALGLADERAHTWDGGLDRLALAHAVGTSDAVFQGATAVPLDAFADRQWLGSIGEILSVLSEARRHAGMRRSVPFWCDWLRTLLERCVLRSDANAHEHTSIRSVLRELARAAEGAGFEEAIPFEAIRERVEAAIEATPTAEAFLAGGVTFCELVPLRAIPFRVVVLLGMADGAFPRGGPAPGFDLMARDPRTGDRTTRNDDRYLFLEALLSAREQLIVTVPAFDMRDGSRQMPSVVVADLIDTLDALFELNAGAEQPPLREWLVVPHPLRASSPRYFEASRDARLVACDPEAFAGAIARRAADESDGGARRRFLTARDDEVVPAAASDGPLPTLELEALIARFLRSTRHFSRDRLQLRLPRPESATGDLDPIDLDRLTQHGLGNALLEQLRAGASSEQALRRLIANAVMPAGVPGRVAATRLGNEVERIARIGFARRDAGRPSDLDFELVLEGVVGLGDCRLVGRLDELGPNGRIVLDFSTLGRRTECDLWIRHLVCCALADRGEPVVPRSVLVARPDPKNKDEHVVVFERIVEPQVHLARLFEWAWSAEAWPLPFFPKSSRAYAAKAIEGKPDQAWRAAYQSFEGGDYTNASFPEADEDLDTARVWEGWSPLDSTGALPIRYRFDEIAELFFRPLLEAREGHRE